MSDPVPTTQEMEVEPTPASAPATKEAGTQTDPKAKRRKTMSNRARKRQDGRFRMNGKGRYVSIKKSENGKKNVQSRAIRLARKLLGFSGRMILLGKGVEGKALVQLCRDIRTELKAGKSDDQCEALFVNVADVLKKDFPPYPPPPKKEKPIKKPKKVVIVREDEEDKKEESKA